MKFGVGQPVPRKEDPRLVTGGGQFTDDINLPSQLHAAFFRSPYSHGRIAVLDVTSARTASGVVAVYTAEDLSELGSMPCRAQLTDRAGNPCFIPRRPLLAEEVVFFVGQAVVAVIAETRLQARDAAELVVLEIEELPVVVRPDQAIDVDAPVLHEAHDSNVCIHYELGDAEAVDRELERATHVVQLDVVNNRVAPSPLEPRSCLACFEEGTFTLYNPSQGAFAQQSVLAKSIFNVPFDEVRVISLDTGGGFGIRGEVQPEPCVCLFSARELGRPVKWTGDRSEMFLTDPHGRDNLTRGTLALDDEGCIVALKIETLANLGAFCTAVGPFVPTMAGGRIVGTVYKIPHLYQSVRPVFTNTMPVAAYRGAGRPEACYIVERLWEEAAKQLSIDSAELRRRNFIRSEDMPFTNHSGVAITSGDFSKTMDMARERADWDGFVERKTASNARGMLRGIGCGYYIESSGGGTQEEARVTVLENGSVDVVVGTYSHGQGHRTMISQIVCESLGVEFDDVNVIQGDTKYVKFGGGTGGSRSSQMGGIAALRATQQVIAKGGDIAAQLLQVEPARIRFEAGIYRADDATGEVTLTEVARAALDAQFGGEPLAQTLRYDRESGYTFPNGCHVAEVEVDPETGVLEVRRYTAVDDCGRLINPMLAAGQVHGGVAQGLGQAYLEEVRYDADGQLITGSLMDYAMPRASQLPDVDVSFHEVLEPNNDLGVKGIGEAGACGAPPALVNAVLNALEHLNVESIDMPLTSEKLWRAINGNRV
ncbi:MAG: xanthine dehydrogenase family protein molybdopterin-binding subunit [Gammaproteobacteria bacterium]|nr:xanthine dehydrogenase family protein molybdopterin-binding subunit [Gammaproteobacteria bacterium]